jgi:ATP-dependent helicase HepA
LKQNDFVRILSPEFDIWGIGKVTGYENEIAKVSFFDSPVSGPHVVETPISTIRPVSVPPQTRAYWFDVGQNVWRVGRVMYHEGGEVDIRFPNQRDLFIPEADVFVRWDVPLADPTGHLASKINETPLFSDARSKYVQALAAQRSATMGMPGLSSSIIDLEPHQIEVVKRVLQDPVQRYLLADEVGLGKTIEAGVLIRQYVLDDPTGHRVVIIVPPALVTQWRDELSRRFLLDAELDDTITVVPSDNVDKVVESLSDVSAYGSK